MKKRLLSLFALLLMAVTGAWADNAALDAQVEDAAKKIAELDDYEAIKYTDEWKQKINAAVLAYEALNNDQKNALGMTAYLNIAASTSIYKTLEGQVNTAIDKIDQIGTVEYTDECKQKIDAAHTAYDTLQPEQKAAVTNADKLTAADAAYEEAKVDDAAKKIAELDDYSAIKYTDEWKQKINTAVLAYEALNNDQKNALGMTAYLNIAASTSIYKTLEGQVNTAIDKIDQIGTVEYTDECKQKIDAAHTAYDTLQPEQKAAVTNADKLTAADAAYEALKPSAINSIGADNDDNQNQKVIKDGKLIIVKNGKHYTVNGRQIK